MPNNEILTKIESMLPFLTNNEKIVAEYILNHPSNVIVASTKELAQTCDVSEPTLTRFTQKIGYQGFKEFKLRLSAELGNQNESNQLLDIEKNDTSLDIYEKLSAYVIASIQSTKNTLVQSDFDQAVDLIYKTAKDKKTVFLSGVGTSSIQVKNLQTKLMRLHIPTVFYEDIHFELEACATLQKDDLLIVVTTLGTTVENHQIIEIAKRQGAKVIVITQFGNTKISQHADYTLYTSVTENDKRLVSPGAMSVQSLIIDTIFFSLVIKMNYDDISNKVQNARDIIDEFGHYK